ncbi:hypothetical protein GCM10010358_30520 [Streptomyces minutiscleroticus]|uniref:Uncharacterized protein n=2 Tax=Streptomyces minutiscleroticus TaxID=68238 RepID=A0A918KSH3_9ACTN|nr:hypothetical protein GCM10010358_30520 [Streptomyces minutiscleroticus]
MTRATTVSEIAGGLAWSTERHRPRIGLYAMDTSARHDGPLSDQEFDQFRELLRRYCAHELDQWESLRTSTPYGPVYVLFTRSLPPDTAPEAYRTF